MKYLPAPEPATPTVAAPAPMNLAAVSISRFWTETESGLKKCQKCFLDKSCNGEMTTYRTAVRVATRGAARTTRFISDQLLNDKILVFPFFLAFSLWFAFFSFFSRAERTKNGVQKSRRREWTDRPMSTHLSHASNQSDQSSIAAVFTISLLTPSQRENSSQMGKFRQNIFHFSQTKIS